MTFTVHFPARGAHECHGPRMRLADLLGGLGAGEDGFEEGLDFLFHALGGMAEQGWWGWGMGRSLALRISAWMVAVSESP